MSQLIDQKVLGEQVKSLYSKAFVPFGIVVVNSLLLAGLLRTAASTLGLVLWLSAIAVVTVLRILSVVQYSQYGSVADATRWARIFTLGVLANGVLWGIAGIVFFSEDSFPHQVFLLSVLGGMSIGAASSCSSYRPAYLAFIIPTMLPISIQFLLYGSELHVGLGVMGLLFTGAIVTMAQNGSRALSTAIRLQIQNAEYADTLRKQGEQASTRFRALLEQTGAIILVANTSNREVLDASEHSAQLMGVHITDVIGRRLEELNFVDSIRSREDWEELVGKADRGDYSIRVARGECELELRVSTREFGEEFVLVVGHDVSERIRLEKEIAQNRRLASLGQLASGVSHEINNPLSYILENLEFLQEELTEMNSQDDTALGADMVDAISDSLFGASRIQTIVSSLSILTKRGDPVARAKLGSVLATSLESLQEQIGETTVAQDVSEVLQQVEIRVEPERLNQVFRHIILNAAQAMAEASEQSTIAIRAYRDDEQPELVFVDIADSGEGISPEVLDHIFDPFYSTRDVGSGTGLGLSICHSIVTDIGGQIAVTSDPAAGTCFRIGLPAA